MSWSSGAASPVGRSIGALLTPPRVQRDRHPHPHRHARPRRAPPPRRHQSWPPRASPASSRRRTSSRRHRARRRREPREDPVTGKSVVAGDVSRLAEVASWIPRTRAASPDDARLLLQNVVESAERELLRATPRPSGRIPRSNASRRHCSPRASSRGWLVRVRRRRRPRPPRPSSASRSARSRTSLVFTIDGEPLLVMTSGAHRVDTAFPRRAARRPHPPCDAETVKAATARPSAASRRSATRKPLRTRGGCGARGLPGGLGGRRPSPHGVPDDLRRTHPPHRRRAHPRRAAPPLAPTVESAIFARETPPRRAKIADSTVGRGTGTGDSGRRRR